MSDFAVKAYSLNVSFLDDPKIFEELYASADQLRKQKIDGFRFQKDKNLSLGVYLLLKYALRKTGIDDFEIGVEERGKPYLKNSEINFSLSHSGIFALCAVSKNPIGCDVETIRDRPPFEIARRIYTVNEQLKIANANESEQARQFYRLWTAKESYLKMTGEGFSRNPKDIEVSLPLGKQNIDGANVTFAEFSCDKDYQATVCVKGSAETSELAFNNINHTALLCLLND